MPRLVSCAVHCCNEPDVHDDGARALHQVRMTNRQRHATSEHITNERKVSLVRKPYCPLERQPLSLPLLFWQSAARERQKPKDAVHFGHPMNAQHQRQWFLISRKRCLSKQRNSDIKTCHLQGPLHRRQCRLSAAVRQRKRGLQWRGRVVWKKTQTQPTPPVVATRWNIVCVWTP